MGERTLTSTQLPLQAAVLETLPGAEVSTARKGPDVPAYALSAGCVFDPCVRAAAIKTVSVRSEARSCCV